MLKLVERGTLDLSFRLDEESAAISRLLTKYRDVPMSLADGCLVRMAERRTDAVVVTLDSDFGVYRKNGRQLIPTVSPV